MENFLLTFEVIFPLAVMMALGGMFKYLGLLDEATSQKMNTLTFKVFLPVMLYVNIVDSDLSSAINLSLIGYAIFVVLSSFLGLTFIIPKIEKDNRKRGVMIQGIFRSNFVIFGIMIVQSIYSQNEIGLASMVVAIIVPLYNLLAVIILEHYRNASLKPLYLMKQIIKNPFIIASFLGIVTLGLKIEFPTFIYKPLSDLAKMASPIALIVLGSTFKLSAMGKNKFQISFCTIVKLIVLPFIYLSGAILLGFKGVELIILVAMLGSPVAVSSFPMAKMAQADDELAGQLVISTTTFSLVSMFVILMIIRAMNLI